MTVVSSLLRLSQRALGRAGRDLIRASELISVNGSLTAEQKLALQRNQIFRDKHKGRRCFVIATGPSLKTQDIEPLGNEITFVMGGFWHHEVVTRWQPTYYCFSDPAYFDGSAALRDYFRSLKQRVPGSTFFAPLRAQPVIKEQRLLPLEQTYWIEFRGELHGPDSTRRPLDLTSRLPSPMSVSQLCIMAANYMGCSAIYLLGLDHDWLAHQGEAGHFYNGHGGLEKQDNFKPQLSDWSYKFLMECQLKLWQGYENLKEIADTKGIRIINATNGGFLDVFDREDYRKLVSERVPKIE